MILQERIPSSLNELTFHARAEKPFLVVRAVLFSLGFGLDDIGQMETKGRTVVTIYLEDARKARAVEGLFKRLKIEGLKVSRKTMKPKDWLTRWKANWKPAALTKHLDVVPLWCKDKYSPKKGRDFILMDTLLSFGTGLHETTRIVSQFIEDNRGSFKSFMDIGTGILTMVAIKNGATRTLAVDIGELSVEAALHNMKVNRLKSIIKKADIKTFRHARTYDFVAANLITHDLIEHSAHILKYVRPGGLLAVSGISLDNLAKLQKAFRALPLLPLKLEKGKQWAGLLYQKKM